MLTFGMLDEQSNRMANALLAKGLKPGDRVALYVGNTIELVVAVAVALVELGEGPRAVAPCPPDGNAVAADVISRPRPLHAPCSQVVFNA